MSAIETSHLAPDFAEPPISGDVERFLKRIVADLPYDDIPGRLKRRQYAIDRLKLEFSKDAARLATEFGTDDAGDRLDAPTAGEWIRHNCKMTRGAAYDCINVGEQLHGLPNCVEAVAAGAIGFAHPSVLARTASALAESAPESAFPEAELLERALQLPGAPRTTSFTGSMAARRIYRTCFSCVIGTIGWCTRVDGSLRARTMTGCLPFRQPTTTVRRERPTRSPSPDPN